MLKVASAHKLCVFSLPESSSFSKETQENACKIQSTESIRSEFAVKQEGQVLSQIQTNLL